MSEPRGASTVAATAYWTAAVRARESARDDRLFDDPWAAALAGEVGADWIAPRPDQAVVPIVLRTRYFDDWLQGTVHAEALRQVVLVGAGLDTRALRLDWPAGTRLFELDQPAILAHKARILDQAGAVCACERLVVEGDLGGPWPKALLAAGFDPRVPSLWLIEGLLFYLPDDLLRRILDDVTSLAARGSRAGFDVVNSVTLTHPLTRPWVEMQARLGAPWIGTLDDPVEHLAERGWAASLTQAGQPDANFGRWSLPILPTTMPGVPHNWFVTALKTEDTAQSGLALARLDTNDKMGLT